MRKPRGRTRRPDRRPAAKGILSPPQRRRAARLLSFVALVVGLYMIMISGTSPLGVKLGKPSPRGFTARTSFECVDIERTERARQEARRLAPVVGRSNAAEFEKSAEALLSALEHGEESPVWEALAPAVRENLRPLVGAGERQPEQIKAALEKLAQMPVASRPAWEKHAPPQAEEVILLGAGEGVVTRLPVKEMVFLTAGDRRLRAALDGALRQAPEEHRTRVLSGFAMVLSPTVKLDIERTLQQAEAAAQATPQVVKRVPQETFMLAEGTEVTRQHLVELEEERRAFEGSTAGRLAHWQRLLGLALALGVVAAAGLAYVVRFRPELARGTLKAAGLCVVTLIVVGAARLFVLLEIPMLLLPVPAVVIVLCLVFDQRFGFEMAVLFGLLVGITHGAPGTDFVVVMIGAMIAALLSTRVRTRSSLIKVGLLTGLSQWAMAWGLGLLMRPPAGPLPLGEPALIVGSLKALATSRLLADSLCALANGVMSGFLVSGLLPAIERLFGVTTDIRLLEWSDPNQPLLQRLLMEAPGTYHHSMMVGSLAADAAEAIGANSLLARVSAYFHDIGKLRKPEYFAENLPESRENPHEGLSPSMSSLIITAHPRDGAQMAAHYGLPKVVRDIVLESHGSTVVKYFWGRAKERSSQESQPQESDFRYRLPRPRSKEAACVMLADAAESAARSLESASPAKIGAILHQVILDRLHDGQLNESHLTLTDLECMENTLVRSLSALFHNRVSYPGQEELESDGQPDGKDPDTDSQPAEQA